MIRNFKRYQSIWSDFARRAPSLSIKNSEIKSALFNGSAPASLDPERSAVYHGPALIDETFKAAYEILQSDSAGIYRDIERTTNKSLVNDLLVRAEKYNPEVLYNSTFENIDMAQPVYRELAKKKWKLHDLMVTMQRLEQLHVIPDTMPTLNPKVNVEVKFPHNTNLEFSDWVAPGTVLPAFAVAKPPTIKIQAYDTESLYTIVLVNPDTPDLSQNSFSTTLHFGIRNVELGFVDNTVDAKWYLENEDKIFSDYVALTPEKNAPTQRAALWVFKQGEEIAVQSDIRENFDIREFAEKNDLEAVGAYVWRQTFDRSVNKSREEFGLEKGRVFERVRNVKPRK